MGSRAPHFLQLHLLSLHAGADEAIQGEATAAYVSAYICSPMQPKGQALTKCGGQAKLKAVGGTSRANEHVISLMGVSIKSALQCVFADAPRG